MLKPRGIDTTKGKLYSSGCTVCMEICKILLEGTTEKMEEYKVAALCAGIIGCSYAIRFSMGGYEVWVQNRTPQSSALAKARVEASVQSLVQIGAMDEGKKEEVLERIRYTNSVEEAVQGAFFIQESASERYDVKQALASELEKYAPEEAIVASSTSGLLFSEIAKYTAHPERFIVGHPCNPPHLVPLVEIVKGKKTEEWAVERAKDFYKGTGMEPVVLQKEVPGFICNRLQMALYREVANLVLSGVCSVEDADKAVTYGPGIRWGIMGPSLVFELGGGQGGVSGLMENLHDSIHLWLRDMPDWKEFPQEWGDVAQRGVEAELKNRSPETGNTHEKLEEYRDRMLVDILRLHGKL